jgi:hypothetical protein
MHFRANTYRLHDSSSEHKSLKTVPAFVQLVVMGGAQTARLEGKPWAHAVHFCQYHVTAELLVRNKKLAVERNVDIREELLNTRSVMTQEPEPSSARQRLP